MGKREQNKADKLRRLTVEGLRLFRDSGYEGASIEQIAQAAGVARGTYYLYFPDRGALFEALVDRFFAPLLGILSDANDRIEEAADRAACRLVYEEMGMRVAALALAHSEEVLLGMQELRASGEAGEIVRRRERQLVEVCVSLTELAAARGLIDAPDPRTDTLVVLGAVERLFWHGLTGQIEDPLRTAGEVVRMLSRGFGAA